MLSRAPPEQRVFLVAEKDNGALFGDSKLFTKELRLFTTRGIKAFENNIVIGQNAGNQHFHFIPQCSYLFQIEFNFSNLI